MSRTLDACRVSIEDCCDLTKSAPDQLGIQRPSLGFWRGDENIQKIKRIGVARHKPPSKALVDFVCTELLFLLE